MRQQPEGQDCFPEDMGAHVMIALLILVLFYQPTDSINCYTCSSHNGSEPFCEDPFHPAHANYSLKCMVPKTGHIGLFPANFCIKITGTNVETGERKVIRFCAMKTMDSQCGSFRYQNSSMKGCILTCDYDGCNAGPPRHSGSPVLLAGAVLAAILWWAAGTGAALLWDMAGPRTAILWWTVAAGAAVLCLVVVSASAHASPHPNNSLNRGPSAPGHAQPVPKVSERYWRLLAGMNRHVFSERIVDHATNRPTK